MTPPAVTVVVDGRIVAAPRSAELRAGAVVGPIEPYASAIATSLRTSSDGRRVELRSGDRAVVIPLARAADAFAAAEAVPLASVARALGARVRYDAASRTLVVTTAAPGAVATPTPFDASLAPPGRAATAVAPPAPTPRPTVTGIPRPRRTPIVLGAPGDEPAPEP